MKHKTKTLFLLSSISTVILSCSSCQSEFNERVEIAKKLKEVYIETLHSDSVEKNLELNKIKKEITFHAVISGNEESFYKELNLQELPLD